MIRWLAILALLWPLSAVPHGGVQVPAAGSEIAAVQSAAFADALDCMRTAEPTHVHCHHAAHGNLAVNTLSPEENDDFTYVAQSDITPPRAAAASLTGPHSYPPPAHQPSFILFGNFRS